MLFNSLKQNMIKIENIGLKKRSDRQWRSYVVVVAAVVVPLCDNPG
jgi:hypothetical protein